MLNKRRGRRGKKSKIFSTSILIQNRRGQVWVETVIYTLIAFALIGAVLGFIKPKIDELKDKSILEQEAAIMTEIDKVVLSAMQGPQGNIRNIEFMVRKGKLIIDPANDVIRFEMESKYQFSEAPIGEDAPTEVDVGGGIKATTIKKNKIYYVTLTKSYSDYDVKYNSGDTSKEITYSANMQKLSIENRGKTEEAIKSILNFKLI